MWTHEDSIEVAATPARIWGRFSDVAGWKEWNAGIETIQIHGAFAEGTTFSMQPPSEEAFTSKLIEVRPNESFVDETIIDETRVLVHHRIEPLSPERSKITYRTEISGPAAEVFGAMVTADFPAVLAALKALLERE